MGSVEEVTPMKTMGESAGLLLRKDGGLGMPAGSSGVAALMAVTRSTAAPSMPRVRSNWRVIEVEPSELTEVIESTPEIPLNCRSRGVATEEAMVAGDAPGKLALTLSVGKSTLGRSATGSELYARTPNNAIANISRLVATGRRMNISEKFNGDLPYSVLFPWGPCP